MKGRFALAPGIDVIRAGPDQTELVLSVLNAAAARLARRGVRQWPAKFTDSMVRGSIAAGDTWVALRGGVPAGTLTLDWADALWPDDRAAGYVHRLAVIPSAVGLGRELLRWAAEQVRAQGRTALRGDCVAGNQLLRAYYGRLGCRYCGDAAVGGSPGQRTAGGPQTVVSLFELDLTAAGAQLQ